MYELGCLHYLGSEPDLIACDEAAAFSLFERAAEQHHTSGLYMLAEMLYSGTGCVADPQAPTHP